MIALSSRSVAALALALALPGCSMAPAYRVPTLSGDGRAAVTDAFKADPGWQAAQPADAIAKGAWWELFGDPTLNALTARVAVTNQTVAQYRAAVVQAQAAYRQSRAAQLPSVSASGTTSSSASMAGGARTDANALSASAAWEVDLWGRLADTARQSAAQAQTSAADLANATLSAQATLAGDYLQLRALDAQAAMLDETIAGYTRALDITRNKLNVGTVSRADVDTAQTTLSNALASREDLRRQRAALEAAIAVLVGENPSAFTLAVVADWRQNVPDVPGLLPADLLQRRPDIASAERAVAAANANIGIQRAAFFPTLSLSGSLSSSASNSAQLLSAGTSVWSLGASSALTLLDFGGRAAKVKQARAAYDQTVAAYRQTVLSAFQEVETQLAAAQSYRAEATHYATAVQSAGRAETIARNAYVAGTADYTTVTSAQATAYAARVNLIQNTLNRQQTAVTLIKAIGGHWQDENGSPGMQLVPQGRH
ncbi:efflux transporter outer membrane subunit [Novosphingobium sp. FSY-8]|uniref:Efflux transporter outer membrane subunit n=1 Tax=Novosphingobium ovatum TaxID=1908523 RepID=A0ABW9X9G8_9SPHN|nr:efflux transporter outer membrane subunit [Novosphingobium ovatum]NBC35171.1 efflux transporter outer membrane subunit [Novosphingobium ovatum]